MSEPTHFRHLCRVCEKQQLIPISTNAEYPTCCSKRTAFLGACAEETSEPVPTVKAWFKSKSVEIPVSEILYFMAEDKYVTVYTKEGERLTDRTIKSLEVRLAGTFLRIRRDLLVRTELLTSYQGRREKADGGQVTLQGLSRPLPVSRRHATRVRLAVQELSQ